MCLRVKEDSKILTATEDIYVAKLLKTYWYLPGFRYSPIYKTRWTRKELKVVPNFTRWDGEPITTDDELEQVGLINAGLHSYTIPVFPSWYPSQKFYEAIIPKGTRYILGKDGEITSLALKLTGKKC